MLSACAQFELGYFNYIKIPQEDWSGKVQTSFLPQKKLSLGIWHVFNGYHIFFVCYLA